MLSPAATTISPTSPGRPAVVLRVERITARAEAYVARCRRALERLRAKGKRTRKVRTILWFARGRLTVLRLGLRCLA